MSMKKSRMGTWKGKLQRGRGPMKQKHIAAKIRRKKKAKR